MEILLLGSFLWRGQFFFHCQLLLLNTMSVWCVAFIWTRLTWWKIYSANNTCQHRFLELGSFRDVSKKIQAKITIKHNFFKAVKNFFSKIAMEFSHLDLTGVWQRVPPSSVWNEGQSCRGKLKNLISKQVLNSDFWLLGRGGPSRNGSVKKARELFNK